MREMTTKEAAMYLGYSHETLKKWRMGQKVWQPGLGPKFVSVNGRIKYREDWLDDWKEYWWNSVGKYRS